ncbi:MAG: hypothetical protein OXD54_03710 [Candidatus Poribacteria bacterium]|nr:hypothetical protein [Candidatus Poribacteria bacterium]
MRQNPLILPLVGSVIAFLCFFFPWLKVDMSSLGQETISISGFTYAIGNMDIITLAAFIASVAVIGISIYMMKQDTPKQEKKIVLICSSIGVLCILLTFIRIALTPLLAEHTGFFAGSDMKLDEIFSIHIGIFGAVTGFILAFIGAWHIPKVNTSIINNE